MNSELTRKILVLLIVILQLAGAEFTVAQFEGGGTEESPYLINDVNDLEELAGDSGYYWDYFILTADIDCAGWDGMNLIIGKDTNYSSKDYDGPAFNGTLEGNYHIIRNLTIDAGGGEGYLGLFGMIDLDGKVKNLGIESAVIIGGDTSENLGVLAGIANGRIDKCYASGAVTGGSSSQNLGGLVGVGMTTITNCYTDVTVTGGAGSQTLGGFIGMNYGGVYNCYASGLVTGTSLVGGFAGDEYFISIIDDCYSLHPLDGGGPDNGLAAVLSAEDMQLQSSFVNWDFFGEAVRGTDEIWMMDNFPVLSWQVPVGIRELAMLANFWMVSDCTTGELCSTVDWYKDGSIDTADLAQLVNSWMGPVVETDSFQIGDDFETGDFSLMPWVMGGDADWQIVSDNFYEGSYSAKSGDIGDSQTTSMEFTVDTTDYDFISFYLKVSSQEGHDKLFFYDNGDPHGLFYGDGDLEWTNFSFNVSSGLHVFKWVYQKDSSISYGDDSAWIDKIEFIKID